MSIENLLKSKVIENPITKYKKELEAMVSSNMVTKLLTKNKLKKEVAEFGLRLVQLSDNYYDLYIHLGSKECSEFKKWIKEDLWEDNTRSSLIPDY